MYETSSRQAYDAVQRLIHKDASLFMSRSLSLKGDSGVLASMEKDAAEILQEHREESENKDPKQSYSIKGLGHPRGISDGFCRIPPFLDHES